MRAPDNRPKRSRNANSIYQQTHLISCFGDKLLVFMRNLPSDLKSQENWVEIEIRSDLSRVFITETHGEASSREFYESLRSITCGPAIQGLAKSFLFVYMDENCPCQRGFTSFAALDH